MEIIHPKSGSQSHTRVHDPTLNSGGWEVAHDARCASDAFHSKIVTRILTNFS